MLPCMQLHETVPWLLVLPSLSPSAFSGQPGLAQSLFGEGPHEAQAWGLFFAFPVAGENIYTYFFQAFLKMFCKEIPYVCQILPWAGHSEAANSERLERGIV